MIIDAVFCILLMCFAFLYFLLKAAISIVGPIVGGAIIVVMVLWIAIKLFKYVLEAK